MTPKTRSKPASKKAARGPASPSRRWGIRLGLVIAVPVLLLLVVELLLRAGGYGHPASFFVVNGGRDEITTNQKFGWRFFPPAGAPAPLTCALAPEKPDGTVRIFLLGGSAARGEPEEAFGLARILEAMLEEAAGGVDFEIVNAAMDRSNSHVALPIAKDCARQSPDLFIVLLGNDEVEGPYGPGDTFNGFTASGGRIAREQWLRSTRLGQLMLRGADGSSTAGDLSSGDRSSSDRVTGDGPSGVRADDPRLEAVYDHFRDNLSGIVEAADGAGAPTLLCTVPTNLKDLPPFLSLHRSDLTDAERVRWDELVAAGMAAETAGDLETAVGSYLDAIWIDDRHADLHYRMGRCLLRLERIDAAAESFTRARDTDGLRLRADERAQQIIADTVARLFPRGARLVDVAGAFAKTGLAPSGIPGNELFHDHVHLNFDGNYLMAWELFPSVLAHLPEEIRPDSPEKIERPSQNVVGARLALSRWDIGTILSSVDAEMSRPPFTGQLEHELSLRAWRERYGPMLSWKLDPTVQAEARDSYRRANAARGTDTFFLEKLATLNLLAGDLPASLNQWRRLVELQPGKLSWREHMAQTLSSMNRVEEGLRQYRRVIEQDAYRVTAYYNVGIILAHQGRHEEAIVEFERAISVDAGDVECRIGLAKSLAESGRAEEAREQITTALELAPEDSRLYRYAVELGILASRQRGDVSLPLDAGTPEELVERGLTLASRGDVLGAAQFYARAVAAAPDEARQWQLYTDALIALQRYDEAEVELRKWIEAIPQSAVAHNNLGGLLARRGEFASAFEHFERALEIDPGYDDARGNLERVRSRR